MKLTHRQICRLFIDFLKKNNALERYKKNILKDDRDKNTIINYINPLTKENIRCALCHNEYYELINYAFCWGATLEGNPYWSALNNKWVKFIEGKNIELIQEKIK